MGVYLARDGVGRAGALGHVHLQVQRFLERAYRDGRGRVETEHLKREGVRRMR